MRKESKELKERRALYEKTVVMLGATNMLVGAHYTAGYLDGNAILQDVANTCAEAEKRLEVVTKQRDELVDLIKNARRTATLKHTDHGHEVVCIEPHLWAAILIATGVIK